MEIIQKDNDKIAEEKHTVVGEVWNAIEDVKAQEKAIDRKLEGTCYINISILFLK